MTLRDRHAAQMARKAELDALRLRRSLTDAEHAEDERLTAAAYMREWRKQLIEQESTAERRAA